MKHLLRGRTHHDTPIEAALMRLPALVIGFAAIFAVAAAQQPDAATPPPVATQPAAPVQRSEAPAAMQPGAPAQSASQIPQTAPAPDATNTIRRNVSIVILDGVALDAKGNPLRQLTLEQLRRAFGCSEKQKPAATWGDLGLRGEWRLRPLHLYAFDMESGPGSFFLTTIQGPSRKMNWPVIREFHERELPDGSILSSGQQTADALANDPYGLAVSGLRYAGPDMHVLALARSDAGPFITPSRETVIDGSYLLARSTYVILDVPPGGALDAPVHDFVSWLLSAEAQVMLLKLQPGFLPLSHAQAERERSKLH